MSSYIEGKSQFTDGYINYTGEMAVWYNSNEDNIIILNGKLMDSI